MNIFERAGFSWPRIGQAEFGFPVVVGTVVRDLASRGCGPIKTPRPSPGAGYATGAAGIAAQAPPYTQQTPEQLQQLVAPIALYPDSLVAQILAASTFPEQVVEADRWVQANPDLKGDALGKAVDQQPWDPSVKALTAFPSVLGNMDKNLSWTSSLGDAYYNQQQDVMDAVQVMRQRAQDAGNLKTTPQQTVTTQGSTSSFARQPRRRLRPRVRSVAGLRRPGLSRGRDGIPIRGFGLAVRIFRSDSALASAGSAVSDGAGVTGDSIGMADTRFTAVGRYYSASRTFYNRNNFYRAGGERGVAGNVTTGQCETCNAAESGSSRIRPSTAKVPRLLEDTSRAFDGNTPGCSRIRRAQRSERRPLGCLQRLRPWRPGQKLFVAWKLQLRWWRRISRWWRAEDFTAAVAAGGGNRRFRRIS